MTSYKSGGLVMVSTLLRGVSISPYQKPESEGQTRRAQRYRFSNTRLTDLTVPRMVPRTPCHTPRHSSNTPPLRHQTRGAYQNSISFSTDGGGHALAPSELVLAGAMSRCKNHWFSTTCCEGSCCKGSCCEGSCCDGSCCEGSK